MLSVLTCTVALVCSPALRQAPLRPPAPLLAVRFCDVPSSSAPDSEQGQTEVGSKAYYKGFFSSPLSEDVTVERGDGTKQAISLAGGAIVVVGLLFVGFMASNGLLS